jgi:hypothetical protein
MMDTRRAWRAFGLNVLLYFLFIALHVSGILPFGSLDKFLLIAWIGVLGFHALWLETQGRSEKPKRDEWADKPKRDGERLMLGDDGEVVSLADILDDQTEQHEGRRE